MGIRRTRQATLFEDVTAVEDSGVTIDYNHVEVSRSTFLGGLSERVHRWFRLTPSFGPGLVRHMLQATGAVTGENVFDPFAGASTTLIEARLQGFTSCGYEINPFLHFVGRTSLHWAADPAELRNALTTLRNTFQASDREYGNTDPASLPYHLPGIYNINRWWRPDVLRHLVLLREAIGCLGSPVATDFFRLVLAGALVPDLTNVTLGRLQLFFVDRSQDTIDVWNTFQSHAEVMIEDVEHLCRISDPPIASLVAGDSVKFLPNPPPSPIDVVITSPPYPNRYSYVWNTRPHLYLLDFFKGKKESSQLDKATIGGTWGAATSILGKGVVPPYNEAVAEIVGPVASRVRAADNLMANYCMKYFNNLAEHLVNMRPFLATSARLAYVVGCSRLKEVFVETDVLLGRLFDALGSRYRCARIERFRKRHSGKNLHESIVYAECR